MGSDARRVGRRDGQRRQVGERDEGDPLIGGVAPAGDRKPDRARRSVAVGREHPIAPAALDDERSTRCARQPAGGRGDTARHHLR